MYSIMRCQYLLVDELCIGILSSFPRTADMVQRKVVTGYGHERFVADGAYLQKGFQSLLKLSLTKRQNHGCKTYR